MMLNPDSVEMESISRLPFLLKGFGQPQEEKTRVVMREFWVDRLGVLTRCHFREEWKGRAGRRIEEVDPDIELEWFALLRAMEESNGKFCAIELGAGYAPWLLRAAVPMMRIYGPQSLDLVAVEGEPGHVTFIHQHARDNGVSSDYLAVVSGAIAPEDGKVQFEIANNASSDWGTRISNTPVLIDVPRVPSPKLVDIPGYSLHSVVGNRARVDFLHVDIQGSEVEVLASAKELLSLRVKRIMIGTHGRAIEGQLLAMLPSLGFRLMGEQPCLYSLRRNPPVVVRDGIQYWVNLENFE